MKKFRYMIITGMLLASIGLAGCGKKSEDDITNKEIYQDDLQPLTEEELNEMDADTSDEDMKQIDEPEDENADSAETADAAKTENKTENTAKDAASSDTTKTSKQSGILHHFPLIISKQRKWIVNIRLTVYEKSTRGSAFFVRRSKYLTESSKSPASIADTCLISV